MSTDIQYQLKKVIIVIPNLKKCSSKLLWKCFGHTYAWKAIFLKKIYTKTVFRLKKVEDYTAL